MWSRWGELRTAVLCVARDPRITADGLQVALSIAGGSQARTSLRDTSSRGTSSGDPAQGDDPETARLVALVDLACRGDAEAFGQLYDHYLPGIFRFVYYRVGSRPLAEDLTSETFTRALRSIAKFRWQGKDFGAWLTTIARNLVADHFKSSRSRLEVVTEEPPETQPSGSRPEDEVVAALTSELLMNAVQALPAEQCECLLMRFVQGLSIAQTAEALGRSEGAVKQLQLRAVRKLARELPEEAVT